MQIKDFFYGIRPAYVFLFFLSAGIFLYGNAFTYPFVHDDFFFIKDNPAIGHLNAASIKEIFMQPRKPHLIFARARTLAAARKTSSSAQPPIYSRTSTTFHFPWEPLPQVQRNRTGRRALKAQCPASWRAWSCPICCSGADSCMAAASGLSQK